MVHISAIVCTYNRDEYIGGCLQSLIGQSLPKSDYEIVVVNNNCTDTTDAICQKLIADNPDVQWRYVHESESGLSFARNKGIAESQGGIVAFLDDDAFAFPDYLAEVVVALTEVPDAVAGGGKVIPRYESEAPRWMSHFMLPLIAAFDYGKKLRDLPPRVYPIGANMFFRASVFAQIGNFNTQLGRKKKEMGGGEEKDIFNRITARCIYVPLAAVHHIIPNKRLEYNYIRNQSINVGRSEIIRMKGKLAPIMLRESVKVAATAVLALYYLILLQPSKSAMIVRFRYWVLSGILRAGDFS